MRYYECVPTDIESGVIPVPNFGGQGSHMLLYSLGSLELGHGRSLQYFPYIFPYIFPHKKAQSNSLTKVE